MRWFVRGDIDGFFRSKSLGPQAAAPSRGPRTGSARDGARRRGPAPADRKHRRAGGERLSARGAVESGAVTPARRAMFRRRLARCAGSSAGTSTGSSDRNRSARKQRLLREAHALAARVTALADEVLPRLTGSTAERAGSG